MINRLTNSSTKEDFPAPPVPVIPNTGDFDVDANLFISFKVLECSFGQFSAADIILEIAFIFLSLISEILPFNFSPIKKSDFLIRSLIIPCNPISLPSSG